MNTNFFENTEIASKVSPLEALADKMNGEKLSSTSELNSPVSQLEDKNPYASGFDKDHPMPTYDQLRNAGFSNHVANQILYGTHSYSDKELFNVLYSDDPVKAYDDMMKAKIDALHTKTDNMIKNIQAEYGI